MKLNLDFSGLFSPNNMKFDFSNLDMSGFNAKEPVSDPVDVVSNKTPTPEVEVLEGAGTVAVTKTPEVKYSPMVQQAIKQAPKDPMKRTAPVASPIVDPIEQAIEDTRSTAPIGTPTFNTPVKPTTPTATKDEFIEQAIKDIKTTGSVSRDTLDTIGYEYNRLQGEGRGSTASEADLQRAQQYAQYAQAPNTYSEGTDVDSIVKDIYYTQLSSVGEGSDSDAGNQFMMSVIGSAVAGPLLTPYVSAAVGTTGLTGATATAVTKGVTNAIVQQAVTGDVDLKGVALASLGGAVEGANEAAANAQANLDNLNEIANSNIAGEALIAQTQLASATEAAVKANATAEVLNNIQTTADIVEAVENKNIIKAVDLGMSLAGSSTVSSIVNENLTNAGVPADYLDVATSTVIKAADTAIKGGDVGDVVQESVNNILIETVATEDNIRQTFNLSTEGFDETLTKTLSGLTKEALEGGNREEILGKGLEAFVKNLPESDTESPEFLQQVEEWWHNNIEDPFEAWWQEIEPQREVIEQAMQNTVDTVKDVAQQAVDVVDEAVRALPPTKEDLEQLVADVKENVVDPTVGAVRETGRTIEEGYDVVEDFVKEDVAPVVRETGRDIREFVDPAANVVREVGRGAEELYGQAEDFVKEDVAPVVREIGRDIRDLVPEGEAPEVDTADVDLPSADVDMPALSADPELTRRNMSYFYDDSSLLRNPLLRSSDMTVQDLTRLLQQEEVIRQAQAEEEERIRRSKPVYGFNPNISVG